MPEIITGKNLSEGIGFGSVIISEQAEINISDEKIESSQVKKEIKSFKDSIQKAHIQLRKLRDNVGEHLDEDSAAIFDAHIMMLDDPGFNKLIVEHIENLHKAEFAIKLAGEEYVRQFETLSSDYMRARALDI